MNRRTQALVVMEKAITFMLSESLGLKALRINPKVKRLLQDTLPKARRIYSQFIRHTSRKQVNTDNLPPEVTAVIGLAEEQIASLTAKLEAGEITVAVWENAIQEVMAQYALAAGMIGADSDVVSDAALAVLTGYLVNQFDYLSVFSDEIKAASEWVSGWNYRAASYALSLKIPYWNGSTDYLPLPAMPAEGTQCQNNCYCKWRIDEVNSAQGDFDCYWILEDGVDHCQTCKQRAEDWNPIKIRNWELQ